MTLSYVFRPYIIFSPLRVFVDLNVIYCEVSVLNTLFICHWVIQIFPLSVPVPAMLRRVYELRMTSAIPFCYPCSWSRKVQKYLNSRIPHGCATFLVDVMGHVNQLHVQLKGKEHLINELFQFVFAFEMNLLQWETQVRNTNYIHFPTLENEPANPDTYVAFAELLRRKFHIQ